MVFARCSAFLFFMIASVASVSLPARAAILGPSGLVTDTVSSGLPARWSSFSVKYRIAPRFLHEGFDVLKPDTPLLIADPDPRDGLVSLRFPRSDDPDRAYEVPYGLPSDRSEDRVVLIEIPLRAIDPETEDENLSFYFPLIRIDNIQGRTNTFTTYFSAELFDAWEPTGDDERAAKVALAASGAEIREGLAIVASRDHLDHVVQVISHLPLGALAELEIVAGDTVPAPRARDPGTTGAWVLDYKRGVPRVYLASVRANPRGKITIYAACVSGEFILVIDNDYEGHRYFDFEDFIPKGDMDITPVILTFSPKDIDLLWWWRSEPGILESPNDLYRTLSGSTRGEMILSGQREFAVFTTDWGPHALFRKIVESPALMLTTWGIPKDRYTGWFLPRASLAKLTAHLPCY